ncbi:MAG: hypothetical protein IPK58_03140 [Acidobacteria bacterium]|nr:hypothetical protein [Acidobacteriota bacterium]
MRFWIWDCRRFRILQNSRFQIPDSRFQIPWTAIANHKSNIPIPFTFCAKDI